MLPYGAPRLQAAALQAELQASADERGILQQRALYLQSEVRALGRAPCCGAALV